jgi:preprotein translocase SecE subunit
MAEKGENESRSLIKRGMGFFSESREELGKVISPSRQETVQATMVTLFIIVVVSVLLALFDVIFGRLMLVVLS